MSSAFVGFVDNPGLDSPGGLADGLGYDSAVDGHRSGSRELGLGRGLAARRRAAPHAVYVYDAHGLVEEEEEEEEEEQEQEHIYIYIYIYIYISKIYMYTDIHTHAHIYIYIYRL